jgi:hypothetical protein
LLKIISPTSILTARLVHVGERAIRVLLFDLLRDIGFGRSGHGYHKFGFLAIDFDAFGDFVGGSYSKQ